MDNVDIVDMFLWKASMFLQKAIVHLSLVKAIIYA